MRGSRLVCIGCLAFVLTVLAGPARAADRRAGCVWNPDGGVTVLPTPGGCESEVYGINNAGHVVGKIQPASAPCQAAVWYNQGGSYTCHTLPDVAGKPAKQAADINNSDWIVGHFFPQPGWTGVFCYEPGFSPTNGTMHQVPLRGSGSTGPMMIPDAISDTGWVTGDFAPGDPYNAYGWHAWRYDAYNETAFEDLGTLVTNESAGNYYHANSYGRDVDNIGRVVGASHLPDSPDMRGFMYDVGQIVQIDSLKWANGITDTSGHAVGSKYLPEDGKWHVRIVPLEGPAAGVETLPMPAGGSDMTTLVGRDLNNHLDVVADGSATTYDRAYWYDYSTGQWHELSRLTAHRVDTEAISDTGLIAGALWYNANRPLPLAAGGGTVDHQPTGFDDGGFTTAGMPTGAEALDQTVELDDLTFVPDGHGNDMVTLLVAYDEAEVLAKDIDEDTLRLYWYDEGDDAWVLAGKSSNADQSTGAFVAGDPTNVLGDWGVDVADDNVWANIDHASTYAVGGVPEPATLALLALGGAGLLARRRKA